ncbi:hypothetical protein EX30DRAFT_337800 [Ascodesmis nigricans]|uniref:J domain-containing protein n=1 Tax=Ascodesmis nigricans TaxID=341454 RepID=A0A4S2N7Y5_9PEZI|nr:hypothetical protein EX30DRAFT_337800 [Ascodesmis nigricans]
MVLPHSQNLLSAALVSRSSANILTPLLCRRYATEAPVSDPYRWPTHKDPTPYDILETPRTGAYNKARYVEIVKLYHPDLSHIHTGSPSSQVTLPEPHVRLERFRMAVAANTLLSNSDKRAAYDRFGIGWAHGPHGHSAESCAEAEQNWWNHRSWHSREGHETFRQAYGRGGPNDASRNATWEDWERWRQQSTWDQNDGAAGGMQREIFAKNGTFMAVVLLLACLGSAAEVGYANKVGDDIVENTNKVTKELGRDITRRRRDESDRDERIRKFLVMRDPIGGREQIAKWEKQNARGVDGRFGHQGPVGVDTGDMKIVARQKSNQSP